MTPSPQINSPVCVTGLGPVCGWGLGVEAYAQGFWSMVMAQREGAALRRVTRLPEFAVEDYIVGSRPYLDPHSRAALAAGALALASAGMGETAADPARSGLAMATTHGNTSSQAAFARLVRDKGVRLASPMLFPHCYANASASLMAIEFGLRGAHENLCGDVLSGAWSIESALTAVRSGAADVMLAGGCDVPDEATHGALDHETGVEGLPAGDGACFLALETAAGARARGALPLCELVAATSCSAGPADGDDDSVASLAAALSGAMESALAAGGLWTGDIGAIMPAALHEGDGRLAQAGREVLKWHAEVPTFSSARVLGHTFGAAIPMECAAATVLLAEGSLPAVPELEDECQGVEFWSDAGASLLMGPAVVVLGWSEHGASAVVLRAVSAE